MRCSKNFELRFIDLAGLCETQCEQLNTLSQKSHTKQVTQWEDVHFINSTSSGTELWCVGGAGEELSGEG